MYDLPHDPAGEECLRAQIDEKLAPGAPRPLSDDEFVKNLPAALKAVEDADADGDAFSNIVEIMAGTQTADASSIPRQLACGEDDKARAAGGKWNVCEYDAAYAYKKVHLDFCGRSPTRAETAAFASLASRDDKIAQIGAALDKCLDSTYCLLGQDGVVWNIANAKIRPAHAVKSGENAGPVPLGDYDDDYNLFTWANSDDHDVRDLLAQYFVKRTSQDPGQARADQRERARPAAPCDQAAGPGGQAPA